MEESHFGQNPRSSKSNMVEKSKNLFPKSLEFEVTFLCETEACLVVVYNK